MPVYRLPAPITVVDLETTWLFAHRHDRIIEIAAVVVGVDGRIEREFVTLVNPGRDIGPTRIHGIRAEDVIDAPSFAEIAPDLIEHLRESAAFAAHNVRFEHQFLESEFARLGHPFPPCTAICTMELGWGGSLASCCADYGISFPGEVHHALTDARATADLLVKLLDDHPQVVRRLTEACRVTWPDVPRSSRRPLTRQDSVRARSNPPTFLQRLQERAQHAVQPPAADGAELAYINLLDRVLEDRHIDPAEGAALVETAEGWGLGPEQATRAHREYLLRLGSAALEDGVVTEAERADLALVARLLGVGEAELPDLLEAARRMAATVPAAAQPISTGESLAGKRVCFTGELSCRYEGRPISRGSAESLAEAAGLVPAQSVTKKLDILVVADPHTQSGKAKKARQYGIRVLHEPVFWRSIGVSVE
jgi:DNA polymerase-3 subunit epsilon